MVIKVNTMESHVLTAVQWNHANHHQPIIVTWLQTQQKIFKNIYNMQSKEVDFMNTAMKNINVIVIIL